MTRWFKHVAAFAAWLGLGVAVQAQPGYPAPVGATRIPEPLSYTPEPQPNMVPGPMNPLIAPMGPPSTLNLPANHTSAFQVENFPIETAWYGHAGYQAMKRGNLKSLPIVQLDNQNGGLDTGNPIIGNLPDLFNLNQIRPHMNNGGRATVGYLYGNQALELTGFWVPAASEGNTLVDQGRLRVPFFLPGGGFPVGYEGRNGIFEQSDLVRVNFTNAVGSAELNYRLWNSGINHTELILGVRYLYAQERVDIYSDDEHFIRDVFGNPDPTRQAVYSAGVRNNILALQMGGEYSTPCPIPNMGWLWFTGMAKGAWGPNFIERTWRLTRGDHDPAVAYGQKRDSVRLSGVYEASGFVDLHFMERVRLRAGYTALWALNVATASKQVDYDLTILTPQGYQPVDKSTMFWHGPVLELQFLF